MVMKKIGEAYIDSSVNKKGREFIFVHRGPLNENDKHWGMRSSMKFRKILER